MLTVFSYQHASYITSKMTSYIDESFQKSVKLILLVSAKEWEMDVSDEKRPDESFIDDEKDPEDADNELLYLSPEDELILEQARMMWDVGDNSYYQEQDESRRRRRKRRRRCHNDVHPNLCKK